LSEDLGTCLTVCAVGRLHDGEVWKAGNRWLLLDDVGLLSVGVVNRLRLRNDARLLVDEWCGLEIGYQHSLQLENPIRLLKKKICS
jgi:hypothetical protein